MNEIGDVSISLQKNINLKDTMVILGFPTLGLIGSIAGNYMADSLHLDQVGSINSKYFLPGVIIKDSTPIPPIRLYYADDEQCDNNGICSNVLAIVSDFPLPQPSVYPLMEQLLRLAEKGNISMFLGLEGIKSKEKKKNQVDVYGVGTTNRMNTIIQNYEIGETKDVLMKGLNGAMLSKLMDQNKDMICMLTETHSKYPDSRAAGRLLEKVDEMLPGIHIDLEPLYEEAENLEKKIRRYVKQSRKIPEQKTAPRIDMYQ